MKRLSPLALFLPLQALLLFWRLDLLSPWFDEAHTLIFVRGPLREAIAIPASGLHPPLYFLLLWCWMRLPLALAWTVQARTLSVLFTLAATVAFDRLWGRQLATRARWWAVGLWSLSPFLLLYGRMSRSYSLQLLLGVVGAAWIVRFAAQRTRRGFILLSATLAIAMYTHYVPGVALAAAANVVLARRRRWRDAAALDALLALALAPWLAELIPQLQVWSAHRVPYTLTGALITEIALKLAYWGMSFTLGEAIPDAVLIAGAVAVPLVLALVFDATRHKREIAWLALPAAAIGFLGVTRWVSYPFIPARMIFCFPLFLWLFVEGSALHRRLGCVARGAMLAVSLCGLWSYFHLIGFRNLQYPLPMRDIAARILAARSSGPSEILVDSTNSDVFGLQYALGDAETPLATEDPAAERTVGNWLADPSIRTIWFLRNTHDVSPGALDTKFATQLSGQMRAAAYDYEPFSPLERRLVQALGMPNPPRYFHELIEYRR